MKRWNGWGDDAITYPIQPSALAFLSDRVDTAQKPQDASLSEILDRLPKSRLPKHPLVTFDAITRLTHARGQSFPNWVELRSGSINTFPDGVAYPMTTAEVCELISYAQHYGIHIIPYGGGTSVVGHIDVLKSKASVLTVDLSRMNRLIDLDPVSMLATFNAGVCGPDLEAQLRAHGFTLGHYPQSFEYSTLGGWVATRSKGQQSLKYGGIERLFTGGKMQTPMGELVMPVFPSSAAGPDLKELVLGSEGRLGILTEACVRISPVPEEEEFHAVFFPGFLDGIEAVQQILAEGLHCCMLRLSTANETATTLALAGHDNLVRALERLLSVRKLGKEKCMLLVGFSGDQNMLRINRNAALHIVKKAGGIHIGRTFGQQWHKNRFKTPYLRNTLWELGYGVDTLETAVDWGKTPMLVNKIETALSEAMTDEGEKIHLFTHLSHVYRYGSSIYTTYLFRLSGEPAETIARWRKLKAAASQAIMAMGGTISHQHGVGIDHLQYLPAEKGPLGIATITAICREFDPKGIMNPGKLVP